MKKVIFLLAFAAAIFTIASCSKTKKKETIKIGINVWAGGAHAFIAQEKGFFEKNGVKVELILKNDITESDELYRKGDIDGVFTVFSNAIMFNSDGIEAKIVYVSDYSDTSDVIIGRSQYKSLAEMRGKTVSFEGINTFSQMFVLRSLERVGIDESEIRFENVHAMDVLSALEQGKIEAGHTWDPVKSQALAKGYKLLAKAGDVPGVIMGVLVFNSKIIIEKPEDIQAIVKSLLQAHDFVYTNREEALEIMSKSEGMSKEEMGNGLNGVHQFDLKENIQAMKKSEDAESLYRIGDSIADFFLKRGQLSTMPDMDEIIESRFVNELIMK
ncbi:MAG: ABC transporter substrate-binding protein [Sedimentisphaerales bacterium]